MKDLIILSDKPITKDSCIEEIKKLFKNYNLFADEEDYVYMGKSKSRFEIWFTPDDQLDDPGSMMEDTVKKCPNKKAYLTNVSYTSVVVVKRLISILKNNYGSMWIQSDEIDDWFGIVEDFINLY